MIYKKILTSMLYGAASALGTIIMTKSFKNIDGAIKKRKNTNNKKGSTLDDWQCYKINMDAKEA